MGASSTEIGLIFSVQVIGFMITSFITGYFTDKVKLKTNLILIGFFGRDLAYFIVYTSLILKNLIGIGFRTFSIGFFAGFFWIPFDTLVSEKFNKISRAHAFGRRDSAIGKGILIGSLLGFGIFNLGLSFNFSPLIIYLPILIFGVANFYAGILFVRKIDESIKISLEIDNTTTNNKSNSNRILILGLVFISIVILLANLNGSLAKPFLNIYLLNVIINNAIIANLAYLPSGIVSMLLAPKLGKLADKIKPSIGIPLLVF